MTDADWHATDGRPVGVVLRGTAGDTDGEADCGAVALVVNTGGDAGVTLPAGGGAGGRTWTPELDSARVGCSRLVSEGQTNLERLTRDGTGEDTSDGTGPYPVLGQSVVVFSAG